MQIDPSVILIQDLSEEVYKLKDDKKILEIQKLTRASYYDSFNVKLNGEKLNTVNPPRKKGIKNITKNLLFNKAFKLKLMLII